MSTQYGGIAATSTTSYASTAASGGAPPTPGGAHGSPAPVAPPSVPIQPTLKVMRLYKPKLYIHGPSSASLMPTTLAPSTALQHEFAMSSMLILPDSFGEIFLGNSFSSYISVINQYACDLRDVGLTANIQCANDRVDLHDNRFARTGRSPPPNPTKVLSAGSSLDMVVDYPLNQVGNHVLRVGVSYLDPATNEPKSLRKFYRFAVQNPLVISFKHLKQSAEESLVEAQIRNVAKLPLFIDSIRFMPVSPFVAEELELETSTKALVDDASVQGFLEGGPQTLLNPQEEVQRVFRVRYDTAVDPAAVNAQTSLNLGRLHVGWKTAVGEAGSVQSQPVMRKAEPTRDVVVALENLPTSVTLGTPFVANATITNHSSRILQLQLQFRKEEMSGIFCSSVSHQNLLALAPKTSTTVPIEFLPTVGGLQLIRGAFCVDVRSGQTFLQDALAHLMVHALPPRAA
ncbi:hypothetical protein Poli38472_009062 [Pythium oligandrum]|uniref:Trafficking protein particle complex subunit 13 n=1 Tax=Pythium oligandrum TaxID=41045 RepID=A0A8K1CLL7_PYTOL|nr:hypothetical protein Poli38472_009062 [Pythium oligandrum]|eukprot:TMW64895.1 hypothetical protein Poli38472_009062 [Pythium oligandrum]